MGAGRSPGVGSWAGAGALLMTLAMLRPRLAHCTDPEGRFLLQEKGECQYTNGTERVRFLHRSMYGRQQITHFDSELGLYVADTELGRPDAEYWNSQTDILAERRAAVDRFCRHNYGAVTPYSVARRVQPEAKVFPTRSGPHAHLLVCSVVGFYPGRIDIKWFRNGQEQTTGVVSTELLHNGDWTFQIQVMLEMSPQRGDVYTCKVEHVSLSSPLTVHWEAQSDSARSKLLTGVGGFVLGLIFLVPGVVIYLRNKKGHSLPQPAGLLS